MKILILTLTFSFFSFSMDCEVKPLNSCREAKEKSFISQRKQNNALKHMKRNPNLKEDIDNILEQLTTRMNSIDVFRLMIQTDSLKPRYQFCKKSKEDRRCLIEALETPIIYSFAINEIDNTSAVILLNKLYNSKRAKYTGTLSSYTHKVKLLRKSYLKRQDKITNNSPLSIKKYSKKIKKLKHLSPRQYTLLRYNYSEIKQMGKVMQKFEQRVLANEAGLYFDYDGDGENDENYVLDEAEKYRMSVKLIKIELEKLSQTGQVFHDKKPSFHDLLVASNELGLISDNDLGQMVELPFLYEKKKSAWVKAGKITWEVGKGVIMAIPGINLFSIIPIVLVESIINAKDKANETSDLHLFTF